MPDNGSRLIAILMVRLEFKRLLSVTVYTPYLSSLGAGKFSLRPIYLRENTSLRRVTHAKARKYIHDSNEQFNSSDCREEQDFLI